MHTLIILNKSAEWVVGELQRFQNLAESEAVLKFFCRLLRGAELTPDTVGTTLTGMNILAKRRVQPFQLSPIKAMELAAAKVPNAISLAQGIPSFETPQIIKDFVYEKIASGACDKYSLTNGLSELREEISLSLQNEGLSYDPDTEIIVTVGSIEGLTASLLACTNPGDEVILPSPTYASYLGCIAIAGCTPRYVELEEEENFDFDVERVASAITGRTKVLLYCTPNNPTGTLYSKEKTERLLELAEKHDLILLVDEVYKDFYYADEPHFSPAQIPNARDRVIRACSFSKAFAMTGWRVGFLLATQSKIAQILKYHDAMVTCAPVVSQYAGIAALRYGAEHLQKARDIYRARRDFSIERLEELSLFVDYQTPQATYFVFPRIKDNVPLARDSNALAYDLLNSVGLATVPGVAFGPSGESHLRINFGRDSESLAEGFNRFADYLAHSTRTRAVPHASDSPHEVPAPVERVSLRRDIIKSTLRVCAGAYLGRNKPVIIGIAGTVGKTVFKRNLTDMLSRWKPTRSGILSYNTEFGLPLSILNLKAPADTAERLQFILQLLRKALVAKEEADYLILEYGVSSEKDARTLKRIANPDWLILTGMMGVDPNVDHRPRLAGLRELAAGVDRSRVLWVRDDPYMTELADELSDDLALDPTDLQAGSLNIAQDRFNIEREFVGESARSSAIAAAKLAVRLGCPTELVRAWLLDD